MTRTKEKGVEWLIDQLVGFLRQLKANIQDERDAERGSIPFKYRQGYMDQQRTGKNYDAYKPSQEV